MANAMIERAYETIRGYVPEDANRILSEQAPRIEQYIDEEMAKFGEELSAYVASEVDRLLDEARQESMHSRNDIIAAIGEIRADVAANDPILERAVARLERSLEDYERRFHELGVGVRKAVLLAVRASGLPIPHSGATP
jgi:hypothetical protein